MRDVVVIGAGPAGCAAAILLARRRDVPLRVTLVEQHRFPRDKVCGECLGALGIDVIDRLDLRARLLGLNPAILTRTIIFAPNGASIDLPLPRPMYGISRGAFDAMLLQAAREAGATVAQPARCESLDPPFVHVRDLVTNRMNSLHCDIALLADGKAALLPQRPRATGDFGIKAHFEEVGGPDDAIELFGCDGCYGGVARIEGGRWNVAFSAPEARLRSFAGDVGQLFQQIMAENRMLHARLISARRVTDWLVAPLPRFAVTRDWPTGVIPLGNAAAALEPIGGEGIGLALRSAELAAEAIVESARRGEPIDATKLRATFSALWRTRRAACRAAAVAVSSKRLADWSFPAIDGASTLLAPFLHLMGK
jgi:flavin-dependent dehydrogenase